MVTMVNHKKLWRKTTDISSTFICSSGGRKSEAGVSGPPRGPGEDPAMLSAAYVRGTFCVSLSTPDGRVKEPLTVQDDVI